MWKSHGSEDIDTGLVMISREVSRKVWQTEDNEEKRRIQRVSQWVVCLKTLL